MHAVHKFRPKVTPSTISFCVEKEIYTVRKNSYTKENFILENGSNSQQNNVKTS